MGRAWRTASASGSGTGPPGQPIHYGNHSCDPNLWHTSAYTLATRRDIRPGKELTVDYATQTVTPAFQMPCRCGVPTCRQVITGNDWQIPSWRDRYHGHVVPAVAKRIAAQQQAPSTRQALAERPAPPPAPNTRSSI